MQDLPRIAYAQRWTGNDPSRREHTQRSQPVAGGTIDPAGHARRAHGTLARGYPVRGGCSPYLRAGTVRQYPEE